MISPQTQHDLTNAKEYFRAHLALGDYYAADQRIAGEWMGEGAARLELNGNVNEAAFLALCDGNDPRTGRQLTPRRNSVRRTNGRWEANRRIFYDFTFSPPKSVSVVALMKDHRITAVHAQAVRVALRELEHYAETRVRRGQRDDERVTGNLIVACFAHDTSRELDPHLHTHCVVFNATFDAVESRWKALHNGGMLRARRYAESVYDHELCRGLIGLGYRINHGARSFEITGVPATAIVRFSKRRQQIDEETAKRIAREGLHGNVQAVREQVAHDKRQRKLRDATADRLRSSWESQLTPHEARSLTALSSANVLRWGARAPQSCDLGALLDFADAALFERKAVVPEHELLAVALARGRGQDLKLGDLKTAVAHRGYVRGHDPRELISREVLAREWALVCAAKDGRGRRPPFLEAYEPAATLSEEQSRAIRGILSSRDFITVFRGGAGTGKSFALREVEQALSRAGHTVVVLAPQRQQVESLGNDGLKADTLARFLQTQTLDSGSTVILDEAGQVGARQMAQLSRIVAAGHGRLILSGDTHQHGAVEASDALHLIEEYSGIRPIVLRTIRRQDPKLAKSRQERAFIRGYREAVKAAASGKPQDSFDRLEGLGCIVEVPPENRHEALVEHYLKSAAAGTTGLLVSQTRAEVDAINETVHARLAGDGRLGECRLLTAYRAIDLTEAAKQDPVSYEAGTYVFFLKRYGRFAKGELALVAGANEHGLMLLKHGRRSRLAFAYAKRLVVAQERAMAVAVGGRLQMKFNGKSVEGRGIANGELVTVRRLLKNGGLVVEDDRGTAKTLGPTQRLFNRGYAVTSYAAQGKTVDTVLFADSGSLAATNRKQWYVTISRGRRNVIVFTPDKTELRAAIQRSGERALAIAGGRLRDPASPPAAMFPAIRRAQTHQPERQNVAVSAKTRVGPGFG